MRYKLHGDVTLRQERFGSFAYVHSRNDFFALGPDITEFCNSVRYKFDEPTDKLSLDELAIACRVGVLEAEGSHGTSSQSYSGVSLIGLEEVPDASGDDPLVVNCFCSAWCPLKCVYCHADDLMTAALRANETADSVEWAIQSALAMKPMVYVVTGGDPISAPERAIKILEALGNSDVPIVLDTSGAGNIDTLLPSIKRFNVHVRVSLDSFFEINDKLRPVNKKMLDNGLNAREMASRTLKRLISEGVNVTVQTVLTKSNSSLAELMATRDGLIRLGVKHWVLHRAVIAGKARAVVEAAARKAQRESRELRSAPLVPSATVSESMKELRRLTDARDIPIDIRYTHSNSHRNCVVLVGSEGDVYTEGNLKNGKLLLAKANDAARGDFMWNMLNRASHIARYLNCQIPTD